MTQPGEFELGELDGHVVDDGGQRAALHRQGGEAVPHRDQTQVHHKCILGDGGLGDDDEGGLQPDVHGETEALLGEVPHAGGGLLRRLGGGGAQGLLGCLEVVHKHLEKGGGWWPRHRQVSNTLGQTLGHTEGPWRESGLD